MLFEKFDFSKFGWKRFKRDFPRKHSHKNSASNVFKGISVQKL